MAKKETALTSGSSEPEMVDEFMEKLKHPMADVIAHLRAFVLSIDKNIGECIFWNAPCFFYSGKMKPSNPREYKRYIVGFNFFRKDTIRMIFLRGADADDPGGILEGDYKDGRRLVLIKSLQDARTKEKDLKKIVKQLLKLMNK